LINEKLPQDIEDIIEKALAKKPEERYQEVKDFSGAYKQALLEEHIRTQTLPSFAAMIIKHAHQEQLGNTDVLSPHVSKALSCYPFDISPAKPAVGLVGSRTETSSIPSVGQQTKGRKQRGYLLVLALCLLIIAIILPFTLNSLASVIAQKKHLDTSSTQIAQR